MKINWKILALWLALCAPIAIEKAFAVEDYRMLTNTESAKTVFDFRDGELESAVIHAQLINLTFDEMKAFGVEPSFAVVFMDSSVQLLSSDRAALTMEEKTALKNFDEAITNMVERGIRLEVCLYAVEYFAVDPTSLPKQIRQVKNGWIASTLYQANHFTLVPVF